MAKTVWRHPDELQAYGLGQEAARAGMERHPWSRCRTYNERAAFNDGWDSVMGPSRRPGNRRRDERPRQP